MTSYKNSHEMGHTTQQKDILQFEKLIDSFSSTPPKDRGELKNRYSQLTELITKIEASNGSDQSKVRGIISRIDPEFDRVLRTYVPLSQNNGSLLVDEYRFFVSGLEIYRNRIAELYLHPSI